MKEKKQTNRLSYSVFGKHFRGFMCMVTFCVFCISTILSIYAIEVYGSEIITNPAEKYQDTDAYQSDLNYEIWDVLSRCNSMDPANTPYGEISILDMDNQEIHFYSREKLGEAHYNNDFTGDTLDYMFPYEAKAEQRIKDYDLMDYQQMKEYLADEENRADYIYFDQESFRELFEKNGLVNEDYRFSEDFSEDAYFIFENYKVSTGDYYEKDESAEEGEGTAEVRNVMVTPYNLTSYAVYDPDEELYYSTQDEYFPEMETYIYETEELLRNIDEIEKDTYYYNSIVIPLLRSFNYSLQEITQTTFASYANMIEAKNNLNAMSHRGIYYYLAMDESFVYSNVETLDAMENMNYYRFSMMENGKVEQSHSSHLPDFVDEYALSHFVENAPGGAIFYIGFQRAESMWNAGLSDLICCDMEYPIYRDYTLAFLVIAIVSFVILMVQAIWLIRTTGRTYKGDKTVAMNFYDKLYTEIWVVLSFGIMIACCAHSYEIMVDALEYYGMLYLVVYVILAALSFGIPFMMLTLSFARRIKGKNLWSQSLFVKLVCRCYRKWFKKGEDSEPEEIVEAKELTPFVAALKNVWDRFAQAIYNVRGTRKLLVLFVLYMVASIEAVVVGMETQEGMPFIIFLALQVAAFVIVLYVIKDLDKLTDGVEEITRGNLDSKVEINEKVSVFGDLAHGINHIGDGLKSAVETSLKDERMKTELITNVSHDLKTPLTSIINYIDLLKKENIPGEDAKHYIEVLDTKSQRLKQLTEDLVEAAKATSGNIELEMMPLTFDELMKQALGEFEDKYEKKNLTIIANYPKKPAVVMADGRRLYRIIENVLQNVYKYALEGTRVYADLETEEDVVTFTLKNVSAAPLNISADELMERFTRGDSSRTTEGSGLGLSIAKDLTRLQNGEFEIQLDGDLFKVIIRFPTHKS